MSIIPVSYILLIRVVTSQIHVVIYFPVNFPLHKYLRNSAERQANVRLNVTGNPFFLSLSLPLFPLSRTFNITRIQFRSFVFIRPPFTRIQKPLTKRICKDSNEEIFERVPGASVQCSIIGHPFPLLQLPSSLAKPNIISSENFERIPK